MEEREKENEKETEAFPTPRPPQGGWGKQRVITGPYDPIPPNINVGIIALLYQPGNLQPTTKAKEERKKERKEKMKLANTLENENNANKHKTLRW